MDRSSGKKVLVTGGSGMLGSALVNVLQEQGHEVIAPSSKELDLLDQKATFDFLSDFVVRNFSDLTEISCVFHLAAKVGGVKGNMNAPYDYYTMNAQMNTNLFDACVRTHVPKIVSVLSTCVYPDSQFVTWPLTENQLHNGPPHSSNFGYAYAKRMLEVQSRAFLLQKSKRKQAICAIPNNLFGPNDSFDLENGHVIPALIRKIWEAKLQNKSTVEIWGDGKPLREFTYSKDAAKILVLLSDEYKDRDDFVVNIGNTEEHSISSVASIIKEILGYEGELVYNTSLPSGQFRKPSSNHKLLTKTRWKHSDYTPFRVALKETCDWFSANYPNVRGM